MTIHAVARRPAEAGAYLPAHEQTEPIPNRLSSTFHSPEKSLQLWPSGVPSCGWFNFGRFTSDGERIALPENYPKSPPLKVSICVRPQAFIAATSGQGIYPRFILLTDLSLPDPAVPVPAGISSFHCPPVTGEENRGAHLESQLSSLAHLESAPLGPSFNVTRC